MFVIFVNINCTSKPPITKPFPVLRHRESLKDITVQVTRSLKYFDISATKILDGGDVQTPTMFDCELQIPEAKYAVRKSIVYYPGKLIDEDSLNFVIRADLF